MTPPRSVVLLGALAMGLGVLPVATTDADTCCFSVCGSALALTQAGLLVTCAPGNARCPRTTAACGVWAEKSTAVRCTDRRTCDPGTYGGRGAEALLARLVGDPDFRVVRPVEFLLSNGTWIGLRPSK